MKIKFQLVLMAALGISFNAIAQRTNDRKIDSLLVAMTLKEKLEYIGGVDPLYIRAIPRLNLPRITMSDGPVGVDEYDRSTAYPAGIMAAATWNMPLVEKLGHALGRDARARGVQILLAPGVNIYRAPMCGRNFEYFGEDPYLTSRLAVNYIKGVQAEGVAATVKHFAGNNQEYDRHHISSDIDMRTLHEIYLPAFKAAVLEAKVASVMDSYNLINGVHATQHTYLNNQLLKKEWKLDGVLMSDWWATYDGAAAANNGLDLEMPSATHMAVDTLLAAMKTGKVTEATIDDKVRRILRMIYRFGWDKPEAVKEDKNIPKDDPASSAVALQVAREGAVLLKNEQGFLPFRQDKIKTLAVIGPNANQYIAGGGSSYVTPFHSVSVLQGIRDIAGKDVNVIYVPALYSFKDEVQASVYQHDGQLGLKAEYFNNTQLSGVPHASRIEPFLDHQWGNKPDVESFPEGPFSARWTGEIRPRQTGMYHLTVRANGGFRLFMNDQKVFDNWERPAPQQTIQGKLDSGAVYQLRVEYYNTTGFAGISFAWHNNQPEFEGALAAARNADAVVLCAGFSDDLEQEGYDRTFELPKYQDSLIRQIAAVNPNMVVTINAGGNVDMQPWLKQVKAVLQGWYPGQEGGTAIAEILFGKTNPSGKLPATFEKQWKDNPTFSSYYDPDGDKHVKYTEGLFVGYRGYEKNKVEPAFPFGFGLSYTTFAYSNLKIQNLSKGKSPKVLVSFDIKNTGTADGAEVAQIYVHQQKCVVERPIKELKGFTKLFLKKGETKRASITLDANAFEYYTEAAGFHHDAGAFDLLIGASSQDIRLNGKVSIL